MAWEKPEYSKSKVDHAGEILINNASSPEEKIEAMGILDNWRASHSYPMHIFQTRLFMYSKQLDQNSIIAQRFKRVPSILFKLNRKYERREATMKLSQMQDIGGCRAILSDVTLARELCSLYFLRSDLKHKLINKKDYIVSPKRDGYRGLHLIYAYKSDKGKTEFNGLLIEIQIRSKLQHIWATAVETVDFFTRQSIKCNEGEKDWADFFRLVSSAFARLENCPQVPNTPDDEKELHLRIQEKARELNIIDLLIGWTNAMRFLKEEKIKDKLKSKDDFYLLELDIHSKKLILTSYPKKNKEKAIEDYSRAEKKYEGNKEYDVVLVSADTTNTLEKAYPNYFVDTHEFLSCLNKIISKY